MKIRKKQVATTGSCQAGSVSAAPQIARRSRAVQNRALCVARRSVARVGERSVPLLQRENEADGHHLLRICRTITPAASRRRCARAAETPLARDRRTPRKFFHKTCAGPSGRTISRMGELRITIAARVCASPLHSYCLLALGHGSGRRWRELRCVSKGLETAVQDGGAPQEHRSDTLGRLKH